MLISKLVAVLVSIHKKVASAVIVPRLGISSGHVNPQEFYLLKDHRSQTFLSKKGWKSVGVCSLYIRCAFPEMFACIWEPFLVLNEHHLCCELCLSPVY